MISESELFIKEVERLIVPATTLKFVAKEKIVVNKRYNAEVKIAHIEQNFRRLHLGKIEEPTSEKIIYGRTLREAAPDGFIIKALGGKENLKTHFSTMFALMEKQRNAQDTGSLLVNGFCNIFYISGASGILLPVSLYVESRGWTFDSFDQIDETEKWNEGCRVFSYVSPDVEVFN